MNFLCQVMFDFSDHGSKQLVLFGLQHQNETSGKRYFLRNNVSPITGGFITGDNSAAYIYSGIECTMLIWEHLNLTPSFAPGLYQ